MELQDFHLHQFTELQGTGFRVARAPGQNVAIELAAATDLGSTARQERFSVLFRGPLDAFLPQQTYPVEHPVLGAFDLFLVPVARDAKGFQYEAIFNRLVGEP